MMAHVDGSPSREDQFVRSNNRLVIACAASFALWQLADVIRDGAANGARAFLLVLSLAAWAAWTALLLLVLRNASALKKDPALRAAMQDERARDVRLRAYRTAFWVTIGCAASLGIPAAAHLVPAYAATRLVVVAGVLTFVIATVVLDRE